MSGISVYGITGCQSPAVCSEPFVMFGVADAISPVNQCQIAHFVEITGTILIFQSYGIESQKRVLSPKERSGFRSLIAEMQFDSFYLMRRNDGAVLCPSVMINGGRYSMRGRSSGKDCLLYTSRCV